MTRFALALAAAALVLAAPGSALAAQPVPISFHSFSSATDFSSGSFAGAVGAGGSVTLASGQTTGSWTSPWFDPQLAFTELVSSWNADTPPGTWLEVRMQGVTDRGTETKWYVMGRWAYGDETILRTSVGGQGDADGYVAIDTFFAKDHPLTRYRLQVTLFRTGATVATADAPVRRRGRLERPEREACDSERAGRGAGDRARRAHVLAGDPRRRVPAVRRRRRGVVQPDLDRDGGARTSAPARPRPRPRGSITPTRGSTTRRGTRTTTTTTAPGTGRSTRPTRPPADSTLR